MTYREAIVSGEKACVRLALQMPEMMHGCF